MKKACCLRGHGPRFVDLSYIFENIDDFRTADCWTYYYTLTYRRLNQKRDIVYIL